MKNRSLGITESLDIFSIPIQILHFPEFFSANIFNRPKLLNTTLEDVTISSQEY